MKNILNRIIMLFHVLFDKDVMLLSLSNRRKDGESIAAIITASNNPFFDCFADNIFKLLNKKNDENLH